MMPALLQIPEAPATGQLSIALIGPQEQHRKAIASALSWCQIGMENRHAQGIALVEGAEAHDAKRPSQHSGVTIREFASYPPATSTTFPRLWGRITIWSSSSWILTLNWR
jgi:hypothetical protein